MELYESRFKKFLNVAKVMKMVGEGEKISGDDAMDVAKNFYDSLLDIDGNDARVLSYIKNILNNKEFVKNYSIDDHIEAYRVSESKIEEGLSSAILSVLASAIMSGSILSTDPHKGGFDPDKFDHGDGIEMTSGDDDQSGVASGTGKWKIKKNKNKDPHSPDSNKKEKSGNDPHRVAEVSISDEADVENAITFKKAKELNLIPIDGPNSDSRLRERRVKYFTVTKPNDKGFSKVIYWIDKEVAKEAGDKFVLDSDVEVSLYS